MSYFLKLIIAGVSSDCTGWMGRLEREIEGSRPLIMLMIISKISYILISTIFCSCSKRSAGPNWKCGVEALVHYEWRRGGGVEFTLEIGKKGGGGGGVDNRFIGVSTRTNKMSLHDCRVPLSATSQSFTSVGDSSRGGADKVGLRKCPAPKVWESQLNI